MQKIRPYKKLCAAALTMLSLCAVNVNAAITRDGTIWPHNVEPFAGYGIVYDKNTGVGRPDNNGAVSAKLEYRIFFSDGNFAKKLMKPVIIIDGFDPGDQRKIQRRDYAAQGPGRYIDGESESIEDMMSSDSGSFITTLTDRGFDVVIVNHPNYTAPNGAMIDGGADYIERNARGHVRLIQELNQELATNGSDQELIVVGPSMGGQISRYALAYMEKHGLDHNTKLWISIDSPHHGANIAIGLQKLVHTAFRKLDVEQTNQVRDLYYNMLQSFAAQQQLIELHNPDPRLNEYAYLNNGSPVRQQYRSNLESNGLPGSNGYPVNLRKIAMVNGSLIGAKNDAEGEENFRVHGFVKKTLFGTTIRRDKILEVNTHYMPAYGANSEVSRLWIQTLNSVRSSVTNNNSNGSMDVVPGGFTKLEDFINKALVTSLPNDLNDTAEDGVNWVTARLKLFNINGDIANRIKFLQDNVRIDVEPRVNKINHTHIPTFSALGIIDPSGDWGQSLNRNLVCTGETPFDSYYAPRENQEHTSFNDENERWLMAEVLGLQQPPSAYPTQIQGSNVELCDHRTRVFSFDRCDVPQPPHWSVDRGLSIVSTTPYSVTVRADDYFNAYSNISASFPHNSVDKRLYVGRPQTPEYVSGPATVSAGGLARYSGGKAVGARSYAWHVPHPYQTVQSFSYDGLSWEMQATTSRSVSAYTGTQGASGSVQIMGVNQCGTGGAKMMSVTHSSSNTGGGGNGGGNGGGGTGGCTVCEIPAGGPIP